MMDRGGTPSRRCSSIPISAQRIRRGVAGTNTRSSRPRSGGWPRLYQTTIGGGFQRVTKEDVEFHWIDSGMRSRRTASLSAVNYAADWLFEGIVQGGGVLTIHKTTQPEGRHRALAVSVAGSTPARRKGLAVHLKQLHEKSGSASKLANFACDIRKPCADVLPEYTSRSSESRRARGGLYDRRVLTPAEHVLHTFIGCWLWTACEGDGLSDVTHGSSKVGWTRFIRCKPPFIGCRTRISLCKEGRTCALTLN